MSEHHERRNNFALSEVSRSQNSQVRIDKSQANKKNNQKHNNNPTQIPEIINWDNSHFDAVRDGNQFH
jgi:hypothetical protein